MGVNFNPPRDKGNSKNVGRMQNPGRESQSDSFIPQGVQTADHLSELSQSSHQPQQTAQRTVLAHRLHPATTLTASQPAQENMTAGVNSRIQPEVPGCVLKQEAEMVTPHLDFLATPPEELIDPIQRYLEENPRDSGSIYGRLQQPEPQHVTQMTIEVLMTMVIAMFLVICEQ